jgi:hypothetical protein
VAAVAVVAAPVGTVAGGAVVPSSGPLHDASVTATASATTSATDRTTRRPC